MAGPIDYSVSSGVPQENIPTSEKKKPPSPQARREAAAARKALLEAERQKKVEAAAAKRAQKNITHEPSPLEITNKKVDLLPLAVAVKEKVKVILKEKYHEELPVPKENATSHSHIVWRGCSFDQLVSMILHQSAGGLSVNPETRAPSEEEAVAQVGEVKSLPEFTFKESVAEGFARGSYLVACKIEKKYLTKGSVTESGVVCKQDAPVQLLGWKEGETLLELPPSVFPSG